MRPIFALAVLLTFSAVVALAQGTYTQIDYPGATETACYGINTSGNISGYYTDSNGLGHGFILQGQSFTAINYPGQGNATYVYGLNDNGQVVGMSVGPGSGFIFDLNSQKFKPLNVPRNINTVPLAVNDANTVVGYYGGDQGFEYANRTYTHIGPPAMPTFVGGITGSGTVVGQVSDKQGLTHDFILSNGKLREITIPNTPGAYLNGVNNSGTSLVGYSVTSSGWTGFLYRNKTVTSLEFPGSAFTVAWGVNDSGAVVGFFYDSSSNLHGFIWTPPAAAEKK